MKGARFLSASAALVLALSACGSSGDRSADSLPADVVILNEDGYHGAVLTEPYVVADLALTDTNGALFSLVGDTDRSLTLVFFGYTNCPDICQIVMSSLAASMTRLTDEQRAQVDIVLVTTDPARDNAEVMRAYLDRFDPTFIGLTGELSAIQEVAKPMRIFFEKGSKLPSGGYEVEHGTPVLGINSDEEVDIVWTEGTSANQFAEDINALLATTNNQ